MSDERSIKVVKGVVLGMTALIVLGLGLLAYGVATRAGDPGGGAATPAVPVPPVAPVAPVARMATPGAVVPALVNRLRLDQPAGTRLTGMVAVGDRLALRLEGNDGRDQVVVVDPLHGTVTGTIDITTGP